VLKTFEHVPVSNWLVALGKIIPDIINNYSKYTPLKNFKKGKIIIINFKFR